MGPSYENHFLKTSAKIKQYTKLLTLEETQGLTLLPHRFVHQHQEEDHGHALSEERDGHLWLDPTNALLILDQIYTTLVEIDPDNKKTYDANWNAAKKGII